MVNNTVSSHYVYEAFHINDADFFNIDMLNDNRKFLNPYIIEQLDHPVAKKATDVAIAFFETVRKLIASGQFSAANEAFCMHLSEPRETCMGLSYKGVNGKGLQHLAYLALVCIYNDDVLKREIKRIEDIQLFVKSIGADRVSDIYTNVIRGVLLEYTQDQCRKYGQKLRLAETEPFWDVTSQSWKKANTEQYFCSDDGRPKLLVPKCFIRSSAYALTTFYNAKIIPVLIEEEMKNPFSTLVITRKDGTRYITKRAMKEKLKKSEKPQNKINARAFAADHPKCVDDYRQTLRNQKKSKK